MSGKRCKQCLALLAAGALMLALLSGCATEKDSGGDPAQLSSFEAEVIRLVNEERAEYGLPALTTTDALTAAAAKLRGTSSHSPFSKIRHPAATKSAIQA